MSRTRMSQRAKVLESIPHSYPGITASQISNLRNVPRANVLKRISDLRIEYDIRTNVSDRSGVVRAYYQMVSG